MFGGGRGGGELMLRVGGACRRCWSGLERRVFVENSFVIGLDWDSMSMSFPEDGQ
jgi:hypothetical protein